MEKMKEREWRRRYAERITRRARCARALAMEYAEKACFDPAVDPKKAADDELKTWVAEFDPPWDQ